MDAVQEIRKCDSCQRHAPNTLRPKKSESVIHASEWPFKKWAIDIMGPFPEAPGCVKFLIVISDNGTQFADGGLQAKSEGTSDHSSIHFVAHRQANGQVERANRTIKDGIKARLGTKQTGWVDELPHVLWAFRTQKKTSNSEIPFSLTYGTEALIPAEIGVPSARTLSAENNEEELWMNLNLLEERRELALI
ncbi:uncharacterized protein LOC143613697 [Bidens hawaiensis]|uniref:uncharacterized protein LOC143613697 n=1 Tax=Bidens hawaiensis TaxID=980011 RepID=UPI00404B7E07